MASRQATKRLNREFKAIQANPPPFIITHPNEKNILEWHYLITGPPDTPYEGGQYHGTLTFPSEYPFKPPAIRMITPNGRFAIDTRLCLSFSDFHPKTWNPSWSVSTILTGLLSFMTSNEETTGSLFSTDATRKEYAKRSKQWNATESKRFREQFPDLIVKNLEESSKPKIAKQKKLTNNHNNHQQQKEMINPDPEDLIRAKEIQKGTHNKDAINTAMANNINKNKPNSFKYLYFYVSLLVLFVSCYGAVRVMSL